MSDFYNDSIFWVEVDKIKPNPYQPRRDFDEGRLRDLADSIRTYGVLQPLIVTRNEIPKEDGLAVEYELISGERRLRASKIAGLRMVPVIIQISVENARAKLEMAIIENLQREDLNAVDRARAFDRLAKEFGFKHADIGRKIGKSREYVSNSVRILTLPEEIIEGLTRGLISEGHARSILMVSDHPEEQRTLFKDVVTRKLSVRDTERIARRIAYERIRKHDRALDPSVIEIEEELTHCLGTRVQIEKREVGGKVLIDFFSTDDLNTIISLIRGAPGQALKKTMTPAAEPSGTVVTVVDQQEASQSDATKVRSNEENEEGELYSVKHFTI